MTTSADRTRRYRARKSSGRRVIKLDIDEIDAECFAVDMGELDPMRADDPASLQKALQTLVDRLLAAHRANVTRHSTR